MLEAEQSECVLVQEAWAQTGGRGIVGNLFESGNKGNGLRCCSFLLPDACLTTDLLVSICIHSVLTFPFCLQLQCGKHSPEQHGASAPQSLPLQQQVHLQDRCEWASLSRVTRGRSLETGGRVPPSGSNRGPHRGGHGCRDPMVSFWVQSGRLAFRPHVLHCWYTPFAHLSLALSKLFR